MGSRGPKPTPTAILKKRGSWRADVNPDEPQVEPGEPPQPKWLSQGGKKAWTELVPLLLGAGVLTPADGHALARYCELRVRWESLNAHITQHGETYASGDDVKSWPQVRHLATVTDQLLRLEQSFGLTPSARSRVNTTTTQKKSGKEDFFNGGLRIAK